MILLIFFRLKKDVEDRARKTAGEPDFKEETLYVDTTRNLGVVLGMIRLRG